MDNFTLRSQLEKLSKHLDVLKTQSTEIWNEIHDVEKQHADLIVKIILAEGLLVNSEWYLNTQYSSNTIECINYDSLNMKTVMNLARDTSGGSYHFSITIEEDIELRFDDSDISLTFGSSQKLGEFVKLHNLKIDVLSIKEKLTRLKSEISNLEQVYTNLTD